MRATRRNHHPNPTWSLRPRRLVQLKPTQLNKLMSLAVIDSSHQVIRFDPTKYRIRQAACDYGIAEAKRIRDWPALEEAVDAKIAEQIQFIAWWYANVTVNHGGNRQKQVSGTRYLSYREAERLTGMKQPRVSELRSWLQHPDEYRSRLLGAAYRAA